MKRVLLFGGMGLAALAVAAGVVWIVMPSQGAVDSANAGDSCGGNRCNRPVGDLQLEKDAIEFTRNDDYSVTNDTLSQLATHTSLKDVNLSGCSAVSDAGVAQLAALRQLRVARLAKTGAGVKTMKAFSRLEELEELDLSLCEHIDDDALVALGVSPRLRILRLSGCSNLTDVGLAHLSKFETLEVLDISWCPGFTGAGLASMAKSLTKLRDLSLKNTPYDDKQIARLRFNHALEQLDLRNMPRLTQGTVVALRENHPNCRVLK